MLRKFFSDKVLFSPIAIILFFAAVKLSLHLIFSSEYGYFRDEFYYIACSENLAFGYVDHPPLIALITKLSILLFGSSVEAIRILPALAGAAALFVGGLIITEIGGGRFAILIGMIAILFSPVLLGSNHTLSMNPFDQLFWTLAIYILILILNGKSDKYWILFGVIIGIGLQNKHSIVFLLFGLLIGMLFTTHRRFLKNKYLWIGAATAFLIFLPNFIWQVSNGFPTLEFAGNAAKFKNVTLSPIEFLSGQFLEAHPNSFIILVIGLAALLFIKEFKKYKLFAWCYIAILLLMIFTNSKTYYLAAIFPAMIAFGAASLSYFIRDQKFLWLRYSLASFILPSYLLILPMALPVLPVETYVKYADKLGIGIPSSERHEMGKLPQHYADMFGWENMAATVAKVYNSLPENEKRKCGIFTGNYGEAGSINFYSGKYNLPKAISGHNNYWLWGYGGYSGEVMIVLGTGLKFNLDLFEVVEPVEIIESPYAMPYENNLPIYICKKPRYTLNNMWQKVKHFN
ncbi:MAG: glycosyltransferase family 39 protein [Ignavibacteriae bacterium]|nr:hypothetical protein [Ignavibacteriota bacterium]NOG99689.1 glycosyltransferase family 39 protein [Ignavibacteriota bacterium]